MANLTTKYLGLTLKNPIIVGSSELTNHADKNKEWADAGAGAIILKSLFEEQILMDIDAERVNNMSGTFDHIENYLGFYLKKHSVDQYIQLIKNTKSSVSIPVIASINCFDNAEWVSFAKNVEQAGADALEVNLFVMPADFDKDGRTLEENYLRIVKELLNVVKIPVAIKLSSYFSGLANFMLELSKTGIKGITLFNKFYSPAVDIEHEKIVAAPIFSKAEDNANTLRWMSILSGKVTCDLSASTGVHSAKEVISNLLVGATTTQMVSAIYEKGASHITETVHALEQWMDEKKYASIEEYRGKLNQKNIKNPMMLERAQFMKYFSDSGK
ncbi:MAG: dihydroorotate dehydrogenase-like protein [Bacteroidales bacterium]|nr:dihydroorotate dehydrogenase-like protein [Bacteroidales bacterium]